MSNLQPFIKVNAPIIIMSAVAPPLVTKTETKPVDFPGLFEIFCENKFGHWDLYKKSNEFNKIMSQKDKFGNLIFHDLVDFVSKVEGIPVKDILKQFSDFVNTYY